MAIGIIGANGFVGSSLYEELKDNYKVIKITRDNYEKIKKQNIYFDVLINANGNASKWLAEKDPVKDLDCNIASIYEYKKDFNCLFYIYISSIDAITKNSIYGIHKALAEEVVSYLYTGSNTIIRCASIIGNKAKKGLVFDILNNKEIGVSKDSLLQLTHINQLILLIKNILLLGTKEIKKDYNCWSYDSISPENIACILQKQLKYKETTKKQTYTLPPSKINSFLCCKGLLFSLLLQKDMPIEYGQLVNENFWNII